MKVKNLANAFQEMFDFITDLPSGLDGFESDFDTAYEELKNIQSENVQEVRHGKWEGYIISAYIGGEDEYGDPRYANRRFYRCSKCYYGSVIKSNFCPNCGTKMDEE